MSDRNPTGTEPRPRWQSRRPAAPPAKRLVPLLIAVGLLVLWTVFLIITAYGS
ncbi:MAG TPA: hypothetical protein PLI18_06170 [Pirellulaceae bacterium]|nr:hypothetical protein [Pirellulaceae bacterium]